MTGVRTRAGVPLSRREVEDAVRRIWARVLDLDPADIGPNDRFPALGGSSLKAMTVLAALEDDLSVTVEPRVLRDHDTVTALAAQLLGRVGRDAGGAARGSATGQDAGLAQEGGDGNGSLPVQESAVAASPVPGAAVSAAGARDGLAAPAAPAAPDAAAVPHPLAVLGMSCRFPGAETPEEFWQLLLSGRDVTGEAPAERLRWTPDLAGHAGAFLAAPADFDAGFFGMDDEEARATDPQARMFLELAHEALERAGYAGPCRAGRRVGVFAAVGDSGYRDVLAGAADGDVAGHPGALTGNLPSLTAARLSQFLDLDGPALAVDTACSSAITALHLARRSLAGGECDIAVVGGVQLALTATGHRLLARAGALSPTGRSRPFGAGADGIVPGEGGAVLVLARLADAEREGDPVLALVRGTAVTNDGRSLGLLAPNPRTQHEVITRAYAECGIDPAEVAYVEAHGTGTPIGDPVEAQSLGRAFPPRPDGRPRPLGSVKANLGHLLNAAGLPALVKTVLALHHREVPPTPHAASAAPYLDRLAPGFVLAAERTELTGTGPLIAGVNAFGFGGTNAHAVLEQAPRRRSETVPPAEGPRLLRLSARHADALREAAGDLAVFVRAHPELSEPGIVAAVDTARDDAPHRLAVVADGDLADRLDAARAAGGAVARSRPRTVFLLPGQGAQRPGQGRALYRAAPAFREVLDEASSLTGPVRGRALADWCLDPRTDPLDLARTEVAQPLLVAYGVGLARQLARWGAIPDAVAGHSVGEIAAACVSGSLTLAEAVGFAAERGRLMGELARPGAMAAVRADEDTVAALVAESGGALWISAVNGPGHVVVSGTEDAVARALAELTGRGTAARRLRVSHAFHCPLVEPVLDPLREAAKALSAGSAAVPMLSTLTAAWAPDLGPAHWRRHAAEPVRFGAAAARLLDEGYDTFVELGPGSTLGGAVRAAAAAHDAPDVAVLTTGTPDAADASEVRALLETAGRLWTRGVALDRTAGAAGRPRVPVPTYPFRRTRYWPRRSGAGGPVRRVVWQEAPPTSARPPRAVRLAGTGGPLRRALAERLTARGLTVLGDDAPGDGGADTLVWLTGEHPAADVSAAVATLRAVLGALPADCSRLLLVTHDAHATGGERAHPERALPHGFALALSDEHPGLTAHGVDLSARDTVTERADALMREVHAAPDPGGSVAWRAGRRLGRRPQALPEPSAAPDALPADGTYLITGGAGGLGSALARDLAGRGAREVILTGRTEAAPGELLAELCDLGTRARYVSADATDAAAVDALVAGLPPLDGLFHAAGTAGPGTLRGKSDAEIERTLAVKVRGTLLLAEALTRHGQEPAVRVVFSSVSSVLPGLAGALGDYAAANAFLDAFAAAEHAAGRPWRSIGFGPVAGAGLAAGALPEARLRALGLTALTPADAIGALRTAVATGAPHLLAAPAR
ncbi:type I polyketide synthase, partial [Streptomyces zinciresistens]|uniref:type I polyketide synthase n=1 Tax=Streptomyces zinciresistens TaxID=1073330 RepID=UPI001FCC15AE